MSALRRGRLRNIALIGVAALVFFIVVLTGRSRSRSLAKGRHAPSGSPPVVMVTVLDSEHGLDYQDAVKENRMSYAKLHGYEPIFAHVGDYDLRGSPMSWTKVVAIKHALAKFPDCKYVWFLDQNAFIMDPKVSLHNDIMGSAQLKETMIRNQPVALPDSIIKTYHLRPEQVDFVATQDKSGMSVESIILRNGEWANFFMDTWYDPLYRSYNFQKAETHALEHIVQWHNTVLAKLALIPQRLINAYSTPTLGDQYAEGDFVVRFAGCTKDESEKSCQQQGTRFKEQWRKAFAAA